MLPVAPSFRNNGLGIIRIVEVRQDGRILVDTIRVTLMDGAIKPPTFFVFSSSLSALVLDLG